MRWLVFCFVLTSAAHAQPDVAAVHGMLLFGKQHTYASHLPMYHAPHAYQAIWQVQLPTAARTAYLNSKRKYPKETVYTLAPRPFVLPAVLQAGGSFSAVLFRGHFERGGVPITDSVMVYVQQVFVFDALHATVDSSFVQGYYVLGTRKEAYAIHRIGGRPSYDHVVQVQPPKAIFAANTGLAQLFTLMPMPNAGAPDEAQKQWVTNYRVGPQLVFLQPMRRVYLELADLR